MKTEPDIVIKNSEELEKYVDENKDLVYPENNISLEFEPKESEIRNIECRDLFLCTFKDGGVEETQSRPGYSRMTTESRGSPSPSPACRPWYYRSTVPWECQHLVWSFSLTRRKLRE